MSAASNPQSNGRARHGHGTLGKSAGNGDRILQRRPLPLRAAHRIGSFVALVALTLIAACSDDIPTAASADMEQPALSTAGGVLVSNVEVASGRNYRVVDGGLATGVRSYTDRDFTFGTVPELVQGVTFIRTANKDRTSSGNSSFLRFTIDREAIVYIAYDFPATPPAWLTNNFTETGKELNIKWNSWSNRFRIYKKRFPAGEVVLGSNRAGDTDAKMYIVGIKPASTSSDDSDEQVSSSSTGFGAVIDGIRPRGYAAVPYSLRQPVNGGRAYYVSTSGSNTNPGTSSSPFRTINKAAQVARAGDVVNIRAGTYKESVFVNHGGTADAPIVFQAVDRGSVVLTGGRYHFVPDNWSGGMRQSGPVFVTLRGLIFRNYAPQNSDTRIPRRAAVGAIRGWRIEDCLFDRAGYNGLDIRGDNVTVVRSTFQYNHTNAVHAWGPKGNPLAGAKLIDVVLHHNNTRSDALWGGVSEKSVKFFRTTGTVIDNVESYENNGPGMWFDHGNTNYVVRNSYFHHNRGGSGRGLFIEISWAPGRVENNVFAYNDRMGVALANSQGVTVTGNLFVNNDRAIALTYANRGSAYPLKDIRITGNSFKGWNRTSAIHPSGGMITTPARMNIMANNNVYDPGERAALTYWDHTGWITSMSELRNKLGWEDNGRIGTVSWP